MSLDEAIEYLAGPRAILPYRVVFVCVVIVGAKMKLEFVWNFSDLMNGMMALPNIIGLLMLSQVVKTETARYFKR
jgi:AGCS family alanine or glycine:cation symporter